VYELIGSGPGDAASKEIRLTDFEGRVVVRSGRSLKITGNSAAHVIVRWRFGTVASATVNGAPATVEPGPDGPHIEFDHATESLVAWQ
jgi:alpha-D-xyloside xylohydrolase